MSPGQCSHVGALGPTQSSAQQNSEDGNRSIGDCWSDEVDGVDRERDAVLIERRAANFSEEAGHTGYDEHQMQKNNETCEQRRQISMRAADVHSRHDPAADGPRDEG